MNTFSEHPGLVLSAISGIHLGGLKVSSADKGRLLHYSHILFYKAEL